MENLLVGTIVDSFSLDGTLKVFLHSSNTKKRFIKGNTLFIKTKSGEKNLFTIESYKTNGKFVLVKFLEISTPEVASSFKGAEILCEKNYQDLDEGYYFYSDLLGCDIVNENKTIGKVIKVEEFPAQITLRCKRTSGKQFFVPFIKQFVKKVDIKNHQIEINLLEGML